MWFHFDLMQIYNANRPTKPQNYFIYTHQTTKEFYIHTYTLVRYKHKSLKKKSNRAAKQHCVSPEQDYLYSVHYQHMQMMECVMQEVKNKNRSYTIKNAVHVKHIIQIVCLCVEGFLLPLHVGSFCLFHIVELECNQYVMVSVNLNNKVFVISKQQSEFVFVNNSL